jgi:hypothetical protein
MKRHTTPFISLPATGPVWGYGTAIPYDDKTARSLIAAAQKNLGL